MLNIRVNGNYVTLCRYSELYLGYEWVMVERLGSTKDSSTYEIYCRPVRVWRERQKWGLMYASVSKVCCEERWNEIAVPKE